MANLFNQYVQSSDNESDQAKDYKQFDIHMNNVEKDFNRLNEFISISLMILGKKGNLPWCKYYILFVLKLSTNILV